jgi:hypothetical protein
MRRCPACQRTYTDDSLTFCLEDGSTLLAESYSASDLPATLIIPDPRVTERARHDARSPLPSPAYTAPPAWSPVVGQHAYTGVPTAATSGKALPLASLLCAVVAFLLLVFCIFGGAAGVEETLLGGVFIFSTFLALVGAVLGIIAVIKTGKNASPQNPRVMAIIALLLNGLYLLIAVAILILAALTDKS